MPYSTMPSSSKPRFANPLRRPRRAVLTGGTAVLTLVTIGSLTAATPSSATPAGSAAPATVFSATTARPTLVLVHGAWADSSAWDGVTRLLQQHGYRVDVFATPLSSLSGDSASLRTYLEAIPGPLVVVGHSYGGAVVSDAATGNDRVEALVYIDAFAPKEGESVLSLTPADSVVANPDPTQVFSFVPATLPPTATTDLYVLPDVFVSAFANDLPRWQANVLASTQRPATYGALTEASSAPAWESIPSWYEVGTLDKVIPPAAQLFMAHRAHSHVVRVATSHLPMISRPAAVDRIIETAARATS